VESWWHSGCPAALGLGGGRNDITDRQAPSSLIANDIGIGDGHLLA
jgi:hypothetical protein